MNEMLEKLLHTNIDCTQIVSASFETSAACVELEGDLRFYRVVCHSSYEEGSFVRTEVWLPQDWNGRFVGLGNGGLAGNIHHGALLGYALRGFAVAQTDMGTSDGRRRGIGCPAVWKDFGWRATHGMTVTGKALVRACYEEEPAYSYFVGASTGGQQALSLAQRFPQDYNGIIAGVPANNRVALHTYFLWNHNHLRTPQGQAMFTGEEITRIADSAAEFFRLHGDGKPGDTFVSYPWAGEDTVAAFVAFLKEKGFTAPQLQALEAVYRGPVDPTTGRQIYNGMPIGSELYGCGIQDCQKEESPHYYPFVWTFGEGYNGYDFDFGADFDRVQATLSAELDANDPDLRAFKAAGGKLIAFSGSADPCVPFPDAWAYYGRVLETMGGYDETSAFFRYFLFPGRDHGGSGRGSNRDWADENGAGVFDALCRWCEENAAPEHLVAARVEEGQTLFTRRIYPCASPQNPWKACLPTCEFV